MSDILDKSGTTAIKQPEMPKVIKTTEMGVAGVYMEAEIARQQKEKFEAQIKEKDDLIKVLHGELLEARAEIKRLRQMNGDQFKWRKKPVEIEAFRLKRVHLSNLDGVPQWFKEAIDKGNVLKSEPEQVYRINTLEGIHTARPGDWIIRGVRGELYPCKHDIFRLTYERA